MANRYLNTVDSEWYRQRLSGALIFVVAAFLVLLARLYYLQIVQGEEFRRLSLNNYFRIRGIIPARGHILDRDGVLLVENRPSFNVSIVAGDAKDPAKVISKLAELLNLSPDTFLQRLAEAKGTPSFKPVLLRRDVSRDAVAVIEAHKLDLPGIVITVEPTRHYIENSCAAHLLGYLGEISREEMNEGQYPDNKMGDFIGKFGAEKAFESFFHGKRGRQHVEVNAFGLLTRVLKTEDAVPGKNIYLALDIELQRRAEGLLEGKAGAVVAMDPSNGHILTMASSPSFDPNEFVGGMTPGIWNNLISDPLHPMENKAIQGQYPPGSTFKIITAMAGLEEGVIGEHTRFFCPGYYRYGNRTFRCWNRRGHGHMNVLSALTQSCDVFFYQVGEKLGVDRIAKYARACGLGSATTVDLDREAQGLVPSTEWKLRRLGIPWQRGETLSVAIGQGFDLATPIQMLGVISVIANGGIRYKPLVVSRIESYDGAFVKQEDPVLMERLPVSEETLQLIKKGLIDAVNKPGGTAWASRVPGMLMAGKTGTAQVVALPQDQDKKLHEETEMHLRDHAWFIAFGPADDPIIAVAVLVEHGGHGSRSAAPIARDMIKDYVKRKESSTKEVAGL